MPAAPAPRSVHVREAWQAWIVDAALISAFMALLVSRSDGSAATVWLVIWVLLMAGEIFRSLRPAATLSPDKIVVHGIRPRELAWAHITDITTEKRLGGARIALVLGGDDRVVLDAPTSSRLARARFTSSLELIRTWWLDHRGSVPPRPAEPPVRARPDDTGQPAQP